LGRSDGYSDDPGTAANVFVGNNLGEAGAGWSTVSGYLVDISQYYRPVAEYP
jgi:hypothetical protein